MLPSRWLSARASSGSRASLASTAAHVTVRAPGLPPSLATDMRRVVAGVDPTIRLDWITPLTEPRDPIRRLTTGIALVIVVVLSSLLFLSAAGVFSLISST
jgi:hypothetical protein